MPAWDNYSYTFGPLVALVGLVVILLLLRWTFSRGRSVVERRSKPGAEDEYGMLQVVARPHTFVEAELLRQRLVANDIRATLAPTSEGPRVMVWPKDVDAARRLIAQQP